MGRETLTAVVLIGIQLDFERDPRKVAREAKEQLSVKRRGLDRGGFPDWKPKVRYQRGSKPRENAISESHKLEVEFTVPGKDLALILITVCAFPNMDRVLRAAGARHRDIVYVEVDRVRE